MLKIHAKFAMAALKALLLAAAGGLCNAKSAAKVMRGWSSWSVSAITNQPLYGREWLTADRVLLQSAAMASSGLQASGYEFINIDSYWAADPTQVVDQYGRWTYNTTRFPDGIRPIADAVHGRGQKLGIYLNPGVAVAAVKQRTPVLGGVDGCTAADIAWQPVTGGNTFWDCYRINFTHPCAAAYIQSMATLLAAEWQVDFLKIDAVSPGSDQDSTSPYDNRQDIAAWSSALEATGRDVWLTISWAIDPTYATDFTPHANAWRVADDVDCYCDTFVSWNSVQRIFNAVRPWLNYSGLGRADPDSLDVGQGSLDGLTNDEKLTYASLWAIIGAPLYSGNDLTQLDAYGRWLYTHGPTLSIADAGVPAFPTPSSTNSTGQQVWAINYGNGTFVVALFNLASTPAAVTATFSDFAGQWSTSSFTLVDVWYDTSYGEGVQGNYTSPALPSHGVQLLRMDVT